MLGTAPFVSIDRGVALPTDGKVYVNRLKEVDKYELRSTAEYFENFKYCVSLATERLTGAEKTIASIPLKERASCRRKMITESIGKKEWEEVKIIFLKKLGNIGKKTLEGGDPLSLLSSNFRILMQ